MGSVGDAYDNALLERPRKARVEPGSGCRMERLEIAGSEMPADVLDGLRSATLAYEAV
jgi:hypothetical protein